MQQKVYKHHVKDTSELRERIVATWDELDQISASSIPQSDSGILVFMLVSKLLVDISSTNCDLLYHISCKYIIAKYHDINTSSYWTA